MKESTYKKLKMLETAHRPHHTDDKRLKVYYGWSKINKVQKREAIAVAFENQEGAGWENSRSGKSLRKTMTVCYERYQTEGEKKDAEFSNRVFTVYHVFLDDKNIKGSLRRALADNSEKDQKHVSVTEREKISGALEREYLSSHVGYREPTE